MKKRVLKMLLILVSLSFPWGVASAQVHKKCLACHQDYKDMAGIMAGDFGTLSKKAGTFTLDTGDATHVLRIQEGIKLKNLGQLEEAKQGLAVLVKVEKKGDETIAKEFIAKPKFEVPESQLMKLEQLKELVSKGPEKGNYVLVDSRPENHHQAGHIPTSINIPFPKMKEMLGALPKEKDKLVIFYCLGVR